MGRGRRPGGRGNPFRALTDGRSLLGLESLLYVSLSAVDLFTTYRLLWHHRFHEANPVARWVFERWNIAGMTLFKFALVILVIVLAETVERHRPRLGQAILILGCLTALYAVFQGLSLEAEQG